MGRGNPEPVESVFVPNMLYRVNVSQSVRSNPASIVVVKEYSSCIFTYQFQSTSEKGTDLFYLEI